jgi:hypothetical protein
MVVQERMVVMEPMLVTKQSCSAAPTMVCLISSLTAETAVTERQVVSEGLGEKEETVDRAAMDQLVTVTRAESATPPLAALEDMAVLLEWEVRAVMAEAEAMPET